MADNPDRICEFIASRQYGVITRQQALDAGLTERTLDRRLANNRWSRAHTCVYLIGGSADTWERRATAAMFACRNSGALSHLTAAAIHGYYDCQPLNIDITTSRRITGDGLRIHRSPLGMDDTARIGCLVVTSAARTIVDLASVLDEGRLEACIEQAFHQRDLLPMDLKRKLDEMGRAGRKGAGKLNRLLEMRDPATIPAESILETTLARVLRRAGLPEPERQLEVFDDNGFITRLDFAYPAARLAIPVDSFKWHARRGTWEKDVSQRNRLVSARWRVRPTTWGELNYRQERFTRDIARLLNEDWH
jgi:hypothetical protein